MMLLCLFIVSVMLGGGVMARTLNQNVRTQYTVHEAEILLGMMDSVRDYTGDQIRPILSHQSEDRFWPESVPAYATQQVFERMRQQPEYSRYSYKEAVLNPTSLRDKADEFEQNVIQQFRDGQIPVDSRVSGRKITPQGERFYAAKAISVSKASCLQCHSTPDVAPADMVEHYGTENGFGWQLNEIVGAQMIYVPMDDFDKINRQLLSQVMAVFIAVLAVVLIFLRV
ncbi:MAG: DUF3365 domain-containing protein [Cyanobacteria bacterium P01_B01_bin.77]